MGLLIFYFLITLFISFTCSLLESTLLSISPAYIAVKHRKGQKVGIILDSFRKQVDRPLTAILTINTFANMMGAIGVGAQTIKTFGDPYIAVASVSLTLAILFGGEIIPKTLGANYWKKLAPFTAYTIRFLIILAYPIVRFTEMIYTFWDIKQVHKITREEMILTAEMGASNGSIHEKESLVIRNLLKLDQYKVHEIMTPRSVVASYDSKTTVQQLVNRNKTIRFSRLPIFEGSFDNVVGLLHRFKLMEAASHDLHDLTLDKLMVHIHSVPHDISVSAALDQFIKRKEHLFLVVDEYGVPTGIVTLEDAIETLLGVEIMDESDSVVDMRQHARDQWTEKKKLIKPTNS